MFSVITFMLIVANLFVARNAVRNPNTPLWVAGMNVFAAGWCTCSLIHGL